MSKIKNKMKREIHALRRDKWALRQTIRGMEYKTRDLQVQLADAMAGLDEIKMMDESIVKALILGTGMVDQDGCYGMMSDRDLMDALDGQYAMQASKDGDQVTLKVVKVDKEE